MLSDKRKQRKSLTVNWLKTKECFGLSKSCLLCLKGSRSVIKIYDKIMVANKLALMNKELYNMKFIFLF